MRMYAKDNKKEMDARDHRLLSVAEVKNGATPKSQTSRGNFFRKMNFSKAIVANSVDSNSDRRAFIRSLLLAGAALVANYCGKPVDPDNGGSSGGTPGTDPKLDSQTNAAVEKLIYDYITISLPKLGVTDYQESLNLIDAKIKAIIKFADVNVFSKETSTQGTLMKNADGVIYDTSTVGVAANNKNNCAKQTVSMGFSSSTPYGNRFFHNVECEK